MSNDHHLYGPFTEDINPFGGDFRVNNINTLANSVLDRLNDIDSIFSMTLICGKYEIANIHRAPTTTEMLYEANIKLLYGTKAFALYRYFGADNDTNFTGLVNYTTAQGYTYTERYWFIRNTLAPRLSGLMGKTLKKLNPANHYLSINARVDPESPTASYEFVDYIKAMGVMNDTCIVELGFFEETQFPDKKYFMPLNRYYSTLHNMRIGLRYLTGYNNWTVTDYIDTTDFTLVPTDGKAEFTEDIYPGDAKLYSVGPVVKYGGTLIADETAGDGMILNDDMIINNGATLSVFGNYYAKGNIIIENGSIENYENGKIYFRDGKKLIIRGNATINGTANDKLTLDFIDPDPDSSNGILIEPGGSLNIFYCKVMNAENGIKSEVYAGNLSVLNVDFTDCESYSVIILGHQGESESTPPPPQIKYCTIQNSLYGISASNLSQIIIRENQLTNTGFDIYLSNVSTPAIIGNIITGGTPQYPGIFLESCGGVVRGNTISGHTNGIHLGNSSPDIGGNILENNWNRGFYVGEGSLPNLEGSLAQDPEHPNLFYAVSGYNKIRNNGGWSVEDDGSEIFLYNSNVILSYGCNEITDQRIPDEEDTPPLYNTQLLINSDGNEGVIEVFADKNFWDEHPIYHLEERFGEYLIVYYEPTLAEPCPQPDGSEGEMYVTSSSGEVIDTLYAEETTPTLTQTEQLYASAEGKFLTADFNGAETIYSQIVNGDDSIQVKLKAYKRLYETGKLTNKPETYFNNLYTKFTSISQSTENLFMKKIFSQLSSLSLIGQQEYVPAINEFDNVVQQSPNTEEAFYAEIDILTTSLLADTGNTQLGKMSNGRYLVKGSSDYMNKLNTLMQKHFGVEEADKKENIIPTEYALFQNYPNPFNPVTIIRYDIPKADNVELKIYDILGSEVITLVNNEKKEAGRYEIQFNASKLATGVYIYRIQTNDYVSSKKMILVK